MNQDNTNKDLIIASLHDIDGRNGLESISYEFYFFLNSFIHAKKLNFSLSFVNELFK